MYWAIIALIRLLMFNPARDLVILIIEPKALAFINGNDGAIN